MALFKQRKLKEATQHFREAVALNPRFALAYYNLGLALAATGAAAEAAVQWRKALEIDPQFTEAAAALGRQGRER
jgi:superkiller protein 3